MKPAVTTLTEDQAVAELHALLECAPSPDQVLEFSVWNRDNTFRAQQLEAHIIHLQNLAKKEDATPQHLQPEVAIPAAEPEISSKKEKTPVTPKKTPKERLKGLVEQYEKAREKVLPNPSNQAFRDHAASIKSHIKALCASFKLLAPELEPLPVMVEPKPKTRPIASTTKHKPQPAIPAQEPIPEEPKPPVRMITHRLGTEWMGEDGIKRRLLMERLSDGCIAFLFKTWWDGDDKEPLETPIALRLETFNMLTAMIAEYAANRARYACT